MKILFLITLIYAIPMFSYSQKIEKFYGVDFASTINETKEFIKNNKPECQLNHQENLFLYYTGGKFGDFDINMTTMFFVNNSLTGGDITIEIDVSNIMYIYNNLCKSIESKFDIQPSKTSKFYSSTDSKIYLQYLNDENLDCMTIYEFENGHISVGIYPLNKKLISIAYYCDKPLKIQKQISSNLNDF